jgi:DNA polymerase-3 subunit gamma/tau
MQDAARNSLLKILEEPPDTVTIVLATARHDALLPTILSRVRPYRFVARDNAAEAEVIRKIFRDSRPPDLGTAPAMLRRYLDSFLPVSAETLYPLAALFVASVAMGSALGLKRGGADLGDALVSLGKHAAPIAENAGLGRPLGDIKSLTAKTLEGADNFSLRSRFSQFLQAVLALVGESLAASAAAATDAVACREAWLAAAREAEAAVGTYNLSPAIALDRLAYEVRRSMVLQAQP